MSFSTNDGVYMARAIELAKRGRFTTSPNPNVGCVIVNQGKIVGEGWHQKAGGPHAEVAALKQAGILAVGATCYVTLEPCSHFGRTPPCAEALINAKVGRVIAAMVDPNPQVSGSGLAKLNAAGIDTQSGLLETDAKVLNRGFIKRMTEQRPFVRCKMASSIDGKTALSNGVSQWITSPHARADVQLFRAQSCAIISGADTVLLDNAALNVRWEEATQLQSLLPKAAVRQPIRVIIDTQHRLTPDLRLFEQPSKIILIRNSLEKSSQWPQFVEQIAVPCLEGSAKGSVKGSAKGISGKADLAQVLRLLAKRGLNEIWIEAGATLSGAFVEQQLVDELILYQAPKLMGSAGKPLLNLPQYSSMTQVIELNINDLRMVGPDIRLTAEPQYS
ncbi:MAG: diaminohydroxyphosphoribosylaminopyrimidine deaminase [Phenylobacterium sp.]|jgi:diaminohydroxyphosphoribosylaminopyrimidine deaminase/5-amino-6-(5-phosphoribosylamino)uracil reductase